MKQPPHRESGASLMILVVATLLLSTLAAYQWTSHYTQQLKQQQRNQLITRLQDATAQLLLFSQSIPFIYANTSTKQSPGFLLCPDMDPLNSPNVGSSNGSCSWATNNAIGRLPSHKSTANGEYFYFSTLEQRGGDSWWYFIHDQLRLGASGSNAFYATNANPVYDTLNNTLTYQGTPIVAAVIYGNTPMAHQSGRSADQPTAQQWPQFLESVTTTTSGAHIDSQQRVDGQPTNDVIVTISKATFDQHIKEQVCQLAHQYNWCQQVIFNGLSPAHWFKQFQWSHHIGTNSSRICMLNQTTNMPDGLNPHECP